MLQPILDDLRRSGRHSGPAVDKVGVAIADEAHRIGRWLRQKFPLPKVERLSRTLDDIARNIDDTGAGRHHARDARAWLWAVDARVVRRARRLRGAIDAAGALYDADRLHNIRIAVKKFRYAIELSAEARGADRTAEIRALKRAQDLLGRLHDFEIFSERVQRVRDEASSSADIDAASFDSLIDAVERECRHVHAAFMSDRIEISEIAQRFANQTVGREAQRQRPRRTATPR